MDMVTSDDRYSDDAIILINMCRTHLQVETISDITDASGTHITLESAQCTRSPHGTKALWPRQPRPTNQYPWSEFIKTLTNGTNLALKSPLGAWQEDPHNRKWNTYFNHRTKTVTTFHDPHWYTSNSLVPHRTRHTVDTWTQHQSQTFTATEEHSPTTLHSSYGVNYIHIPDKYQTALAPAPTTWEEHLSIQEEWIQTLLRNLNIPDHSQLLNALACPDHPNILLVSDGSYKAPDGASTWLLATQKKILASTTDRVSGNPITPLRTEGSANFANFTTSIPMQLLPHTPTAKQH
jgi:hypothetical protein